MKCEEILSVNLLGFTLDTVVVVVVVEMVVYVTVVVKTVVSVLMTCGGLFITIIGTVIAAAMTNTEKVRIQKNLLFRTKSHLEIDKAHFLSCLSKSFLLLHTIRSVAQTL